jgi:hypothetical protein
VVEANLNFSTMAVNSLYTTNLTIFCSKDITSSTLTTSDVNIFETVGNGLLIEDVIVTTDGTGLASGTNFVIKANGVTVFSTAISGLGANATKDLRGASVTGIQATIPQGTKYITVANTVAAGTGAGIATVTIKARKLDSSATIRAL